MIGLAFSGGKDSWACLWLNKHRLHELQVIWVNTGKNYPELLKTIDLARAVCPNFHEVRTDRDGQNRQEGIPAEIVPVDWTSVGQAVTQAKPAKIQSYLQCCFENISGPLLAKAQEMGLSELIVGQRDDESHRGKRTDGDAVGGIVYRHPIQGWTSAQVMTFLEGHMAIPEHFRFKHSSLDCYDCTAYREDSRDRIDWMRETHPSLFNEYSVRADQVRLALSEAMARMR